MAVFDCIVIIVTSISGLNFLSITEMIFRLAKLKSVASGNADITFYSAVPA